MVRPVVESVAIALNFLHKKPESFNETLKSPTQIDIIERKGKLWLPIRMGGIEFQLPLVHISDGNKENDIAIAWFDPSKKKNRLLAEKARDAMAHQLEEGQAQVVFMTNSLKSEWFIREAVKKVNKERKKNHQEEILLMTLPSGKDKKEVALRSLNGITSFYKAVTGDKYMGLPKNMDIELIKKLYPDGRGLVLADDVFSTGGTSNKMKELLGLTDNDDYQLMVIGIEGPVVPGYPKKPDRHIKNIFFLPEFIKLDSIAEIDREKLFPIKEKQKIPRAHIVIK